MEDKSFGRVESIPKEHRHQSYWDMFATWLVLMRITELGTLVG